MQVLPVGAFVLRCVATVFVGYTVYRLVCPILRGMGRRGGDDLKARGSVSMPASERDRLIVELAGKGWNHARIAACVGMSRRGVGMSLERIADGRPGRDARG